MKKRVLVVICSCFFLALPAVCLGANGWYGSVNAGVAMATDSDLTVNGVLDVELAYDAGYTVGGALGYMMENYRIEGEIAYQANDVESGNGIPVPPGYSMEASVLTFLVNGYLDIDTGGPFTPFVTAGLGAAKIEFDMTGEPSEDDTVFAYQLGAGIGFAVSESVTLDLRYRYLGLADMEFTDGSDKIEVEAASHNITLGLRVAF